MGQPVQIFGTSGGGGVFQSGDLAFCGDSAVTGWIKCLGQAISRSAYPGIFARWGTTFGNGDGSTTFNLPKPQGLFPRFADNGAGVDPDAGSRTAMQTGGATGDTAGSVQADQNISHRHLLPQSAGPGGIRAVGGGSVATANSPSYPGDFYTQVDGGSEARPKNFYLNLMIKI